MPPYSPLVLVPSWPHIILDDDELLLSLVAIVVLNPFALCVINAPPHFSLMDFTPGIVFRLSSNHGIWFKQRVMATSSSCCGEKKKGKKNLISLALWFGGKSVLKTNKSDLLASCQRSYNRSLSAFVYLFAYGRDTNLT